MLSSDSVVVLTPDDNAAPKPMRILVAEAEGIARQLMLAQLNDTSGVEVVAVASGEAAVEAYRQQPFDLIFMTVGLAGLPGLEAGKRIASLAAWRGDWLYLTFLTADAVHPDDLAIVTQGVCDLIKTPVRLPTLAARVKTVRELIAAREYAAESEQRLKSLMAQTSAGMALLGTQGQILDANRAAEWVLGFEPGMLVGHNISEFVSPDRRTAPAANSVGCPTVPPQLRQVPALRRDGSACLVDLTMNQVFLPKDGPCIALSINDVSERAAFDNEVQYLETHDSLTQLPNRRLMQDRLIQALALAKRHRRHLALLFIDIDGFKMVNDTYGHAAGDKVLLELAHRFKSLVREGDTVCRQGGDEFVVVLAEIAGEQDAAEVAQRFLDMANRPIRDGSRVYQVGASIGIATYPAAGEDAETLMRHADMAMYHIKDTGKGAALSFSSAMSEEATRRIQMENQLHDALRNNEFELFYQPQIDFQTGALEGVEALIRWRRNGKMIFPDQFIPVAEASGLILPIGEWVASEAGRQSAYWRKHFGWAPVISVNITADGFNDRLVAHLKEVLEANQLPPMALALELTESMLATDIEDTVRSMNQLRDKGVAIAVDDFGTGYSAMSYLRRYPLTALKIDKAFIAKFGDQRDAAIVQAILTIAKSLNLKTVAEGVETKEQLEWLRQMGCDVWQGYFASPPRPPKEIEAMYPDAFRPVGGA